MRAAPSVIVFAREPIPGATKTRLMKPLGANNAAALAHAFTIDALAKVTALDLPLVIAGSSPDGASSPYFRSLGRRFGATVTDQGEGTLGARMRRSLEPYSVRGAILIGTDTPSMPRRFIGSAVALLRRSNVVLGPSLDGGYYLIATRGEPADIFRGIRWGSAHVFAQTLARLERSATPYVLTPPWYDIDCRDDLLLLAAHLRIILSRGEENPCPATSQVLRRLGLLGKHR